MKAIEFKSKIQDNKIKLPLNIRSKFTINSKKNVKVILLINDVDVHEDLVYSKESQKQFLKGYADSDSIYDS